MSEDLRAEQDMRSVGARLTEEQRELLSRAHTRGELIWNGCCAHNEGQICCLDVVLGEY